MRSYKDMALTANFNVERLDDPQEEVARATLLREKATTNYEALALSTYGRICGCGTMISRCLAAVFRRVCGASAEATDKAVVAHFHKDQNRTD